MKSAAFTSRLLACVLFLGITSGASADVIDSFTAAQGPMTVGPGEEPAEENVDPDGEGCQLTLERDQVTFILTCYFYYEGEQFWVIGVGELVGGEIVFGELTITSGAQYGDDFDPADVVRETFGEIIVDFTDCNNFTATVNPVLEEFHDLVLNVTKIVPGACP